VDVEEVRPVAERDSIVARFFSARERAALASLPGPLRSDAFFRTWTCKEAYIKAIGTGLATPLDGFSVAVDPREPPGLLEVAGDPGEAARWSIRDLDMGPGYAGAVMAEGTDWELVCYEYEDAPPRGHS
jgi:4'-phosphopantetheinyl transferase